MQIKQTARHALGSTVVRIYSLGYQDAGGYGVKVTHRGRVSHWVYRSPISRREIVTSILEKIRRFDASFNSRGR